MSIIKGKLTTSDYLPIDEFNRLCECLNSDKNYFWELYVRVSYCTALRVSDTLSLTWKQILCKDELIKKEQKTSKIRTISFNESVKTKLQILYELLGSPDINTLIFVNTRTGNPYTREYINRRLKYFKMKYNLKIKHFSTHTFRKTFGRQVYDSMGQSHKALMRLNRVFRHSDAATTLRYIGINDDEISEVYNYIKF